VGFRKYLLAKSKWTISAGYIDHMGNEIYKNFRFKNLSKRDHLVDLNLDGDISKIDPKDACCEGLNLIELFQDRVLRVMNPLV
jgi:hypothetical protein